MARWDLYSALTTILGELTLLVRDDGQANPSDEVRTVTLAKLAEFLGVSTTGWQEVSGTWTYASATTITVPSGAASIYSVGTKLKMTNSGTKYNYVVAVADTLLTVAGDGVANAAITVPQYSNMATPVGFPGKFTLGTPTWTTSGTPFTNQPVSNSWQFSIQGRMLLFTGTATCHATSGGTGVFIATFAAGSLPAISGLGAANCTNNAESGVCRPTTANEFYISKYNGTAIATNSEIFNASLIGVIT